MAIRFYCRTCRQLLAIGSRKAGTDIDCPKCGQRQTVPTPEQADALLRAREAMAGASLEGDAADEFALSLLAGLAPPKSLAAPPVVDLFSPPEPPGAPPRQMAFPAGMVLVRRRTVHLQAAFFLVLSAAMFALGYWLGHRAPPGPIAPLPSGPASAEPSLVEGQIFYEDAAGKVQGDMGSVVIALPDGKPPRQPLVLTGLDPDPRPIDSKRPSNPDRRKTFEQIRQLGGAFGRADRKGSYLLVLRPGHYRILFVSAHARRPDAAAIDEADLIELRRYFAAPERFIGAMKYSWRAHAAGPGAPAPQCDFGRDEGGN